MKKLLLLAFIVVWFSGMVTATVILKPQYEYAVKIAEYHTESLAVDIINLNQRVALLEVEVSQREFEGEQARNSYKNLAESWKEVVVELKAVRAERNALLERLNPGWKVY